MSTCAATSIRKKLHTDQIRVIFAFISLRTHNDNLSLSLSLSLFVVPTYLSLCVNQTSNNTMGLKRKKRGKKLTSCIVSFECQLIELETLPRVCFKRFLTNERRLVNE